MKLKLEFEVEAETPNSQIFLKKIITEVKVDVK
jgi:hypothetical protein